MKEIIFLFLLILNSQLSILKSQTVRPIRDSIGFCWNAEEMNRFVGFLDKHSEHKNNSSQNLIAAISVHDDYLYAGKVYYPLFKLINTKEVVIFGVTHGSVRKELGILRNKIILDEYDEWCGPFSRIKISPLREIIKSKLEKDNFIVSNKAHNIEHSIEALIPFLQYYNRDIKITPIMVTQMSPERTEGIASTLAKIISEYVKEHNLKLGKDIFFLISNDANHYGVDFGNSPYGLDLNAHKLGTENDQRIINKNLAGKINLDKIKSLAGEIIPDSLTKKVIPLWCGRYPMTLGLQTVSKILTEFGDNSLVGKLFKYSDTMTEKVLPFENTAMGLTAVFSPKHWCGWFTLGLYSNQIK
jgi:MEMO1 family protein